MIKPNYAYEKRQKEIAKKQKKQEKQLQKSSVQGDRSETEQAVPLAEKPPIPR
jgi:hypothetical protein